MMLPKNISRKHFSKGIRGMIDIEKLKAKVFFKNLIFKLKLEY